MITQPDPLDVLNKVDAFYNSAWNMLIIYTTILLALVGVILPILISWWQNRVLKFREESLKKEFLLELQNLLSEFKEEFAKKNDETISEKFKEINETIENKISSVDAGTFHIQGNSSVKDGDYRTAIESFIAAGEGYLKGEDFRNLNCINGLINKNLGKLTKQNIEEMELGNDSSIKEYLSLLKKANKNGIFSDVISDIRKTYEKILKS